MSTKIVTLNSPGLPLTYPDLVCLEDVDPLGRETTSDLQNLIQDVQHVIEEDLGSNLDDPQRGVGIRNYLSGTQDDLAALPGVIKNQLLRDARIDTCAVSITAPTSAGFVWVIAVDIGVGASVIPLQFGWQLTGALVLLTG